MLGYTDWVSIYTLIRKKNQTRGYLIIGLLSPANQYGCFKVKVHSLLTLINSSIFILIVSFQANRYGCFKVKVHSLLTLINSSIFILIVSFQNICRIIRHIKNKVPGISEITNVMAENSELLVSARCDRMLQSCITSVSIFVVRRLPPK